MVLAKEVDIPGGRYDMIQGLLVGVLQIGSVPLPLIQIHQILQGMLLLEVDRPQVAVQLQELFVVRIVITRITKIHLQRVTLQRRTIDFLPHVIS